MTQIDSLEQIKQVYINRLNEYQLKKIAIEVKIETKNKQIQRLQKKRKQLHSEQPYWTEIILKPVINILKNAFPDWLCDDEKLSPMGIGCRVTVFFIRKNLPVEADKFNDSNSIYISFRPGDLKIAELLYQTGETINEYSFGTIGEINGHNNVTKPAESIEELIQFLNAQIIENGNQ